MDLKNYKKNLYIFGISIVLFILSLLCIQYQISNFRKITYKNYVYLNQAYDIFSFYQRNSSLLKLLKNKSNLNSLLTSLNLNILDLTLLYKKDVNPYIFKEVYKLRIKTDDINVIKKIIKSLTKNAFIKIDNIKIRKLNNSTYIINMQISKYTLKR